MPWIVVVLGSILSLLLVLVVVLLLIIALQLDKVLRGLATIISTLLSHAHTPDD